jgi:sensor histidine kinase YesM
MNNNKSLYKKLLYLGTFEGLDDLEDRKVRILNLLSIAIIAFSVLYLPLNSIQGYLDLYSGLSLGLSIIGPLTAIILQAKYHYFLARVFFILTGVGIVFIQTNITFPGFYGEYNYLFAPLATIFFFEKKWIQWLTLVLSIVLFYLPNYYFNHYPEQYYGYTGSALFFFLVFQIVLYFKKINMANEKALAEQKLIAVQLTEQKLLRSQISPHFTFNTLELIRAQLEQHNTEKSSDQLLKFARLTRTILEHTRADYISLAEDLNLIRKYIDLVNATRENPVELQLNTERIKNPDQIKIPPLFIQPFIENSIEHGIRNKPGTIQIAFLAEDQRLTVEISDNGVGIQQGKLNEYKSLSTAITKERLELLEKQANSRFSHSIENKIDQGNRIIGAKVILRIPFLDNKL